MAEASFVKIGGELLSDSLLAQVTVSQELNHHWWCELECRQTSDQRFPAEDMLGKDLTITAVGEDGAEVSIFSGFILESELEYEASGSYGARMRAVSRSYLMDLTPRRQYYFQQSANQVAQKLASATGLSLEGSVDGPQLSYVQIAETDFHYLLRLVDESEKWLRPAEKGIEIQNSFQSGVAVVWRGEHGLLHFSTSGKLAQPSAAGAHYDYRKMMSEVTQKVKDDPLFYGSSSAMVEAVRTKSASVPSDSTASRKRLLDVADLQDRLKKETRRSLGQGVICRGVSRERTLKAGNEVEIKGTPDANGTYGIVRVVHRWTSKGYENEFLCTPWKKYTHPNPPRTPHSDGLVPARVLDNNDPQGLGRLQVQYFWQEDSHTCWLRLMTPHSGADRGFMFLPEIGDEVWVMYEEGDPERARVLGSSWNGVLHPPREKFWGDDITPNDVKRIVTKSGHRITIVDKPGKNSIVVATPKHLKISLIENSDETGDAMLTLHSDGDILLSAPNGRIHSHSKLLSREVGSAASALAVLAPGRAQHSSNAASGWSVPGVLKILCAKDRNVVAGLSKLNVTKYDSITFPDHKFDGKKWTVDPFPAGGTAQGNNVTILSGTSSQDAATTLYHEWWHTTQPASMNHCDKEREAYAQTEQWSIDRGLPGQGGMRTMENGKSVPDKTAIEQVVKTYPGCGSGQTATDPYEVGYDPDKNLTEMYDPKTNTTSWRPSKAGDKVSAASPITKPAKPTVIPKSSWKCP